MQIEHNRTNVNWNRENLYYIKHFIKENEEGIDIKYKYTLPDGSILDTGTSPNNRKADEEQLIEPYKDSKLIYRSDNMSDYLYKNFQNFGGASDSENSFN
jgi:hypothetical protein